MLPQAFLDALAGQEEIMITSREGSRERSVRGWYVVQPTGAVYLFASSFSLRVSRWRTDPWIRLTVPGGGPSVEGRVHEVGADDLDDSLSRLVQERWSMWGATTPEGLRRMLRDRSHVLFRVDIA